MDKTIYLAGAMGCYDINDPYPYEWRKQVENALVFYECFNPTLYYNFKNKQQKTEKEVLRYEINALKHCDLVVVNLKDIEKSIGTVCELMCAYENRIPVIGFIEEDVELHPWIKEICDIIEIGDNALTDVIDYVRFYY